MPGRARRVADRGQPAPHQAQARPPGHAHRDGTFVFYSAADVHVRKLLDEALFRADHADQNLPDHPDPNAQADRSAARGAPA